MSKQCLDVLQMQHLKDLGVDTSKANFYWHRTKSLNNYQEWDEWKLHYGVLKLARGFKTINCGYVRTFTLQDIIDLLPIEIYTEENELATLKIYFPNDGYWEFSYMGLNKCMEFFLEENIIDAAYEMLCWCIKNGYVKTNREG